METEQTQNQVKLRTQCFGRKKNATAVALCESPGRGMIKVNGVPLELVRPEVLRIKVFEPLEIIGHEIFQNLNIRVRVNGGGHVAQLYAIRQAISKAVVSYHQKYVDEVSKMQIKDRLLQFDRSLLVMDPRRVEAKKFGGRGARARFQKP